MVIVISSCVNSQNKGYYEKIYKSITNDKEYEKFIGYHIVRRNEDQFFYKDLSHDSSAWQAVLFRSTSSNMKHLFEIMYKYKIKAVVTLNYNSFKKKLEYKKNGANDFHKYELNFFLSDGIKIVNINFDIKDYDRLIKDHYSVVEKLDSKWFVLKKI